MDQKLIMEGWRRFLLNENIESGDICLYHHGAGKPNQRIILYKPVEDSQIKSRLFLDTIIVGAILFQNTNSVVREPCIPETFQVSTIFTHKDYEGQGLQKLMMDCAFYVLGKEDKGLTSDQQTGTKYKAARAWDKIENSSEYKKRETDDGNSEFDYTDQTEDPNDDCSMPSQSPAAIHSFEKQNASKIQPQYDSMKSNHINFLKKIGRDRDAFNNMLKNRSRADFIERYQGL